MNLELLPNEILLDLFNHFDGINLLRAFHGLNSRLNFLLYKQFRRYSFTFSCITKRNFDMICQQHLPLIADRVYALRLSDSKDTPEQINLFFTYIVSFSRLTQLRSLSLSLIRSYEILLKVTNECQHLCNLTHLNFSSYYLKKCQVDFQLITNNIWSLPKLRYCNFHIRTQEQHIFGTPTKISSTLEYLNMHGYKLKWNHINQLFEYTPRLKHLSIPVRSSDDDDYSPMPLPTLISFDAAISCTSNTSKLLSFLQNTPNLRRLNVNLRSCSINGYQWEQAIRNYLPKLKVFRLQMEARLSLDENIEERVDELIDSFRSSFWIDEYQWFVRCLTLKRTIHLYTLSKSCYYHKRNLPDMWRSTCPQDNQQKFYDNIISIDETFFDQTIPFDISLSNISNLRIKLPLNDQFWSIVPSLNRLYSLHVSFHADTFQSQLQDLLDRTSRLCYLHISQDESLPLQNSLFKYTSVSVRYLDLQECKYWFNEEECMALCHSPLGIQCEVLSIHVKNRQSIIILVKNMTNLRALHIECEGENFHKQSTSNNNGNNELRDENNIENKDDLAQWLKHRLLSTCLVIRDPTSTSIIHIWI